jgi:hypothetical protein
MELSTNRKNRVLRAPATNFVTLIGTSLSSSGAFAFVSRAKVAPHSLLR